MSPSSTYTFKVASEDREFEEIHKLNYRTFVEEIPQHEPNLERSLVDKFHLQNTYIICLKGKQLVGMICVRAERPFSLDYKLDNLDSYLPEGRSICEIRLLAVDKAHRNGRVFCGLMKHVEDYFRKQDYDLGIVSGTVRQLGLYTHLGFVPFGPLVGTPEALYQPMYLALEDFEKKVGVSQLQITSFAAPVNLLPGPVTVRPEVRRAFAAPPVSHRSQRFVSELQDAKRLLLDLLGAQRVEILLGSGSLANDAIAGQLSLLEKPGLILSNGEFGDRLVDHAHRFRLRFEVLQAEWGEAFDYDAISRLMEGRRELQWLWAVHCETSTGVLNNLAAMKRLCGDRNARLCVDCVSSIGTVPVSLSDVYLASCVSGKGLGGFPGLSMVFYNHAVQPAPKALPKYLDLGVYAENEGVPFTQSSNLIAALCAALRRLKSKDPFEDLARQSASLRKRLREAGFTIIAPESHASPGVVTIGLPCEIDSEVVGLQLEQAGYLLSYRSNYLLKRNWVQICLMGEHAAETLDSVVDELRILVTVENPTFQAAT